MKPNMLKYYVIFACVTLAWSTDVFSSTAELNSLVINEAINTTVQRYIEQEEQRMLNLKSQLQRLVEMKMTLSGHPVGVYHMLKAYHDINLAIRNTKPVEEFRTSTATKLPDAEDIVGAALGIIRLQKTFQLPVGEIIRGKMALWQRQPMTADEAFYVAKTAFDNEFYNEALDWMKTINETYGERLNPKLRKQVFLHMAQCYEKTSRIRDLRKITRQLLRLYPGDSDVVRYYEEVDKKVDNIMVTTEEMETSDMKWYRALCRGDANATSNDLGVENAVCRYRALLVPYDRVKEEVLSLTPYVMFYYDVVTNRETHAIKTLASMGLSVSKVGGGNFGTATRIRVSKTAWLHDDNWHDKERVTANISSRVARITGLSTRVAWTNTHAEMMQVVNYGIGGQYDPHMDANSAMNYWSEDVEPPIFRGAGDRIATFLLYLSSVQMGGATVFPRARLKVDAVKNGAVFWYNLLPSGAYDWLTFHAGCPVLLGQKWIANKWFRENGQMFRRPCGLDASAGQAVFKID